MLEGQNLRAYAKLLGTPGRLIWLNLLAGLARGLGMALGFSILGAVVLWVLKASFMNHLPLIGSLIARVVRIVQQEMGGTTGLG